jgi:hypothetical protein
MAGALAAQAVAVFDGKVHPEQSGAVNVPFALLASGSDELPLLPLPPPSPPEDPPEENEANPLSPPVPEAPECVPHAHSAAAAVPRTTQTPLGVPLKRSLQRPIGFLHERSAKRDGRHRSVLASIKSGKDQGFFERAALA